MPVGGPLEILRAAARRGPIRRWGGSGIGSGAPSGEAASRWRFGLTLMADRSRNRPPPVASLCSSPGLIHLHARTVPGVEAPPLNCAIVKGKRASHKPLLVLLATSWWLRDRQTCFHFRELEAPLSALLRRFGPQDTRTASPLLPFWHLQSDGIWVVSSDAASLAWPPARRPTLTLLREKDAYGEFIDPFATRLFSSPDAAVAISHSVLRSHFDGPVAAAIARELSLPVPR